MLKIDLFLNAAKAHLDSFIDYPQEEQ